MSADTATLRDVLRDWVLVCAAPVEADGLDACGVPAHVLGVGKAACAAALTELLLDLQRERRPAGVLLFGVAGAVPARHRPASATGDHLQIGGVCVVGADRFGDEGVATERGFLDLGAEGLVATGPFAADAAMTAALAAQLGAPVVGGVTVSTCSGSEAAAGNLARRTGALVESMEGAAAAFVAARRGLPFAQLRAISNFTGDRDRAGWDLATAVHAVQQALHSLYCR